MRSYRISATRAYNTLIVVKLGDCSEHGYIIVEFGIGGTILYLITNTSDWHSHKQWNIKLNMMSMECVADHGICLGQLNITFDNLSGISRKLTEANRTSSSYSVQFRYRSYRTHTVDLSSTVFVYVIKDCDPSDKDEEGGFRGTNTDGKNTSTQDNELSRVVSSSLQLDIVTEFVIFCSLIVLSFKCMLEF